MAWFEKNPILGQLTKPGSIREIHLWKFPVHVTTASNKVDHVKMITTPDCSIEEFKRAVISLGDHFWINLSKKWVSSVMDPCCRAKMVMASLWSVKKVIKEHHLRFWNRFHVSWSSHRFFIRYYTVTKLTSTLQRRKEHELRAAISWLTHLWYTVERDFVSYQRENVSSTGWLPKNFKQDCTGELNAINSP